VPNESSLPSPAPEILEYLSRHPNAQDTIEGILQWWVLDSCLRNWAPKIAATVQQLVGDGFLEERAARDGRVFYRISPRYLARLRGDAPNNS
jgi:hypothetical protein